MSKQAKPPLRVPQYRVLKALLPKGGRTPALTRTELAARAGFQTGSGTINRALNGIAKGSSSGDPYPGIVDLGYVRRAEVHLDGGLKETVYQITAAGQKAARAFAKERKVSDVRRASASTNKRYSK